jgi:hypothetical protein
MHTSATAAEYALKHTLDMTSFAVRISAMILNQQLHASLWLTRTASALPFAGPWARCMTQIAEGWGRSVVPENVEPPQAQAASREPERPVLEVVGVLQEANDVPMEESGWQQGLSPRAADQRGRRHPRS